MEARGGSSIRGEVLSWMTFVQFVANISAPLVLGYMTSLQPVDARYMFLTCTCISVVSAGILYRIIHLGLMPGTGNSKNSASGGFKAIRWGSGQDEEEKKESTHRSNGMKNEKSSGIGDVVSEGFGEAGGW